jgi:hypothetical protein
MLARTYVLLPESCRDWAASEAAKRGQGLSGFIRQVMMDLQRRTEEKK